MGTTKQVTRIAVSALTVVALTTTLYALAENSTDKLPPEYKSKAELNGAFQVGLFYRTAGVITPPISEVCTITVGTSGEKRVDFGGGSGCDNDKVEYFAISGGKKGTVAFYDKHCDAGDLEGDDFYIYRITTQPLNHAYIYGLFDGNNNPGIPGMVPVRSKYKNGLTGKVSCVIIDPD